MDLTHELTYRERIDGPAGPTTGSPHGERLCWSVTEATVTGPDLDLRLAMPGADWMRIGSDGIRRQDQRLAFVTPDDALVLMRYDVGLIRPSPTFLDALRDGDATDFADQYMRMAPVFETGDPTVAWLQEALWVAEGRLCGEREIEYRIARVG